MGLLVLLLAVISNAVACSYPFVFLQAAALNVIKIINFNIVKVTIEVCFKISVYLFILFIKIISM